MLWRGAGHLGPTPPEPWPFRVEAFRMACALYAGQRERDLIETVQQVNGMLAARAGKK